jgi:SAM-dependent methyltransferase
MLLAPFGHDVRRESGAVTLDPDGYGPAAARFYDRAYATLRDPSGDVAFYRGLARETGGRVLELGCGTGRVLLPIAADGIACTGIDRSPHMIDALRRKHPPGNVHLVTAAIDDFDLTPARFRLVLAAFRVLQHLYTVEAQLRCLACVRRHLEPGGRFAFDVFAPDLARVAHVEEPEVEDVRFEADGEEIVRFTSVVRDHAAQVQRVRMRWERRREGTVVGEEVEETRMRWFFRYELEHLLARAGFTTVAVYGGFDRQPFDHVSGETVVVAG